jgi:hypothetical protein
MLHLFDSCLTMAVQLNNLSKSYFKYKLVVNPCDARENFVIRYNTYIVLIECHDVNKKK